MSTLGGMIDDISERLIDDNNTSVSRRAITKAINDSINFYKNNMFWFNTETANITIAEADTTVTLPSDFLIDLYRNTLIVDDNGEKYEVRKIKPHIFDAYVDNTGNGRPEYYKYYNGVMSFYPYADKEYPTTLNYVKNYTDFSLTGSDDALSNDWTTTAEVLIRSDALARLHGELRQDEKMSSMFAMRANAEFSNLKGRTNVLNKTGTLTIGD